MLTQTKVPKVLNTEKSLLPDKGMEFEAPHLNLKGLFGCKLPPYYNCLICASFSVTCFVISSSYYYSLFESVIESTI